MLIPIDHIQITVKDIKAAEPFYDRLMPILGYDLENKISVPIPQNDLYVVEYLHPQMDFGICSPREAFRNDTVHRRKPGSIHHIAFRADNRQHIDELYGKIKEIPGVRIVSPPRIYEEHGPDYYALFFKDPDGIKFEIVYNQPIG
ncbi:MAG: VOC family protein [Bacteroidales bacterium]|jgi:catechol 2,3-dioxygenase-like lactoylglutathione lyase family enzyme|nr:VOC family protein [Bacteroidales bacterium]